MTSSLQLAELTEMTVSTTMIVDRDPALFVESLLSGWESTPSSAVDMITPPPLINEEHSSSSSCGTAKTSTTLLEVKDFLVKSLSLVTAKIVAADKRVADISDDARGELILHHPEAQLLEPRGRFTLDITTTCLLLEGKIGGGLIPLDEIVNIALLPSHTTAKKEGEDLLVLTFDHPLKICGKDMRHLLFNLSKSVPKGSQSTETESSRVVAAIQATTQMKINVPNANIFRTIGGGQKPFLRCHRGTQEGAIYPLYCGVFFIKPVLFIYVDEIASLSAGRGGGSGNTRFVDVRVSF
jgi:hypothetical protein